MGDSYWKKPTPPDGTNCSPEQVQKTSLEERAFHSDEACAKAFDEDMSSLTWNICEICKVKTLGRKSVKKKNCPYGSRCWQFSFINNMDPGDVPDEL
ncbi:Guanine nucleotide exchange factor MSS4 [Frankliniella fusca]|uniref:Guanine nucleotide exchange factor MSS4 n=1 Tax=Frankliniella fusca TaxID=407009 RepID=A0AAE1HLH5_9NEOP|nr:Guanine nucleotide exchange factor MSS4 [Frankliniella fusca]